MLAPSQVGNDSNSSIPPPDIKSMVDKVARFVASRKPELEKFIARNAGMCKYSFLNGVDPYHPYYQHRLSEFRAQNGSAEKTTRPIRPLPDDKNADVIEWILKKYERFSESFAMCDTVIVSPLTGELVTYSNMSEHMQDPKYKEQKEILFAKIREATYAQDDLISRSILAVARRSPDRFGTTEEEVCNAVKAEIDPVLFSDSKRRQLDDDDDDYDDSLLVFEDEFLSQHPGPACISVWVEDKGQMLEISVESLSESVGSLKEKIARQIGEVLPADKLKLKLRGTAAGFFKDWPSLAYYNVAGDVMLSLSW